MNVEFNIVIQKDGKEILFTSERKLWSFMNKCRNVGC